MKKVLSLMLALVLCLSLCACGKSKAAKSVEVKIEELTNVTYDDKDKVATARRSYSNLSEKDKEDVENLTILEQAEKKITEEEKKLIDSIVAENDPDQAITLLRQMEDSEYARSQISALGVDILFNYVIKNGYSSDYRGQYDAEGQRKSISVKSFYFVANPGYTAVNFVSRNTDATNHTLLAQYKIDRRERILRIQNSHISYEETEWIEDGWKYVCNVSMSVDFDSQSDLDNLHPTVTCSEFKIWPYSVSKEEIEKHETLNVEHYINLMDECVSTLDIPVTGWEMLGFFK